MTINIVTSSKDFEELMKNKIWFRQNTSYINPNLTINELSHRHFRGDLPRYTKQLKKMRQEDLLWIIMKYEEPPDMITLLICNMSQQKLVGLIFNHSQTSYHGNAVGGLAPFSFSNSNFPLQRFLVKSKIIVRKDKKPALNLF